MSTNQRDPRRKNKTVKRQKGGEYNCPKGMPPRLCEKKKREYNEKAKNTKTRNQRLAEQAQAKWNAWRALPEEERIIDR